MPGNSRCLRQLSKPAEELQYYISTINQYIYIYIEREIDR